MIHSMQNHWRVWPKSWLRPLLVLSLGRKEIIIAPEGRLASGLCISYFVQLSPNTWQKQRGDCLFSWVFQRVNSWLHVPGQEALKGVWMGSLFFTSGQNIHSGKDRATRDVLPSALKPNSFKKVQTTIIFHFSVMKLSFQVLMISLPGDAVIDIFRNWLH